MAAPAPALIRIDSEKPDVSLIERMLAKPNVSITRPAHDLATLGAKGVPAKILLALVNLGVASKAAWTMAILFAAALNDAEMLDALKAKAIALIEAERAASKTEINKCTGKIRCEIIKRATANIDADADNKLRGVEFELPKVELPAKSCAFLRDNKAAIVTRLNSDRQKGACADAVGDRAEGEALKKYLAEHPELKDKGCNIVIDVPKSIKGEVDGLFVKPDGDSIVVEVKSNFRGIASDTRRLVALLKEANANGLKTKGGRILVPKGKNVTAVYLARRGDYPVKTLTEVMAPSLVNEAAGKLVGAVTTAIFKGEDLELQVEGGRVQFTPPAAAIKEHVDQIVARIQSMSERLNSGSVRVFLF